MLPQPSRQNSQGYPAMPPVMGMLAPDSSGHVGPVGSQFAITLSNLIPGEFGCRVRPGSVEWASGLGSEVRSLLEYADIDGGGNEIFACCSDGVYDITAGGAGPHARVLTWPSATADSGYVSAVNFTNINNDHFLLICDETNGYYIYNGTTWDAGTFTGSPTPAANDLVHICEWNGRIWFTERNRSRAWYLDPASLSGDITGFDVGSRFKAGGFLKQQTTLTMDGGDGMDDKLVQLSDGGDVLVWEGINPSNPTEMRLVGRWVTGSPPKGRRAMSDWGGDVMVLTNNGLVLLSSIIKGTAEVDKDVYLTRAIAGYVRQRMAAVQNDYGWGMVHDQSHNIIMVTTPNDTNVSEEPIQFAMDLTQNAWCVFRGLDMLCAARFKAGSFFGDRSGSVFRLTGTSDNVMIGGGADFIEYSMLTHFDGLNDPSVWKRVQFIRPNWQGSTLPHYAIKARYDFDLSGLIIPSSFNTVDLSLWDDGVWGGATWAGTAQSYTQTLGGDGMGRYVALAMRGRSNTDLTYIGSTVIMDQGGML